MVLEVKSGKKSSNEGRLFIEASFRLKRFDIEAFPLDILDNI